MTVDLEAAIEYAVQWWVIDMAAPTFEHDEDDAQARIAEMAVSRASRPSPQEIVTFAISLKEILVDALIDNLWESVTLTTDYEPKGLLADAIRVSGRTPNVHHLSWFKTMKITREGEVRWKVGKDSWTILTGGKQ